MSEPKVEHPKPEPLARGGPMPPTIRYDADPPKPAVDKLSLAEGGANVKLKLVLPVEPPEAWIQAMANEIGRWYAPPDEMARIAYAALREAVNG